MFMLIIVNLNDLLESFNTFNKRLPLFASSFKFIFYLNSIMIMLSVKHNAVHAEELLSMVLASFYMAIENLDASSFALALDSVCGSPITEH